MRTTRSCGSTSRRRGPRCHEGSDAAKSERACATGLSQECPDGPGASIDCSRSRRSCESREQHFPGGMLSTRGPAPSAPSEYNAADSRTRRPDLRPAPAGECGQDSAPITQTGSEAPPAVAGSPKTAPIARIYGCYKGPRALRALARRRSEATFVQARCHRLRRRRSRAG